MILNRLTKELLAAGLPLVSIHLNPSETWNPDVPFTTYLRGQSELAICWSRNLTTPETDLAASIVQAFVLSHVDDDLDNAPVSAKLIAAVVVAIASLPAQSLNNVPTWARNTLVAARNRINTIINGRTPSSEF
jgi:hypothetical protein